LVVDAEIAFQALLCLGDSIVGRPVNRLVLDAFPEPFDKDLVDPTACSIQALLQTVSSQQFDKIAAGERTAVEAD